MPNCLSHLPVLDAYAEKLSFPVSSSKAKLLPGWTDGAGDLKRASCFWHKVWVEAGCPTAGVLSQQICSLGRRKDHVNLRAPLHQEKVPSFGVRSSNFVKPLFFTGY